MRLPGLTGLQLLKQLNRDKIVILVILISGYADDFAASALAEGAFSVLDKPIQAEELIGNVRAAIDSTRP